MHSSFASIRLSFADHYCPVFMTIYLRRFLTKRRDRQTDRPTVACRMCVSPSTIYPRAGSKHPTKIPTNLNSSKICGSSIRCLLVSLFSTPLFILVNYMLSLDAGNSQWQRIEVTGIILAAETSLSPRSSRGRMVAVRKDGRVDADGWCGAIALSAALPPPTQTRLTNQPIAIKKFRPNRN